MSGAPTQTETSPSSSGGPPHRVRQLRVVFSPRPPPARAVALERAAIVVGREPATGGGLKLEDPQASREHARVEPDGDGWAVADLESRNGTYLNGARCRHAPLRPGDVIRVGGSLLLFVDVEVPADARLEPETPDLRGQSLAMQRVRGAIALVAGEDLPVLILGETGVGKERVAHELHRSSGRAGPFVGVNCAAIADALADSELFGHVAGAFTGATVRNEGLFAAAEGGTLFLDEVGELSPAIQAKLLRALAEREVRPVGASATRSVDVRVVAATLRPLGEEVAGGRFRSDLLARLAGWTISIPPLRERRDDILRLAQMVLERHGGASALSLRAAEALLIYGWPLNVRELEQALAVALINAAGEKTVARGHLPEAIAAAAPRPPDAAAPAAPPLEIVVARDAVPSADELRLVLERFNGNVARVAEYFGKGRLQIYRWAERHELDLRAFRR